MILTIIIPTLGRDIELYKLLESIPIDLNFDYEILVIDQNFNDKIDKIIFNFSKKHKIIHFKVDFRSLSKAKNFGISKSLGKYICFPDDDSKFLDNSIINAISFLEKNSSIDIIFGKCIDEKGNDSVIKFFKYQSFLTLKNFEGKFIESTMFAKSQVLKLNLYDENLGVGSFFGAEEGFDLVFRLLKKKYKLYYDPAIQLYHPQIFKLYSDNKYLKRVFEYRKGYGYICKKHNLFFKFTKRLIICITAIFFFNFINYKKSKFYLVELFSIIIGFIISNEKN